MTLNNFYISFLNLAHRADRLLTMKHALKRAGIDAERTAGIVTKDREWNKPPYKTMYARTPGAIGCMLGQMKIMKTAHELGKHAFVMEDDLIFSADIHERMNYIFKWMERNEWDVFWLGGTVHLDKPWWHGEGHKNLPECDCTLNTDAEPTEDPHIFRSYGSFSTHCYLVNHASIPAVIDMLEGSMSTTIGIDYSFIRHAPKMRNYVFLPGSVIQRDNPSDIGRGITMFSGFKKLGSHWFKEKL